MTHTAFDDYCIVVLDSLGLEDEYTTERAEEILELFDWTGLEVVFHPITLDHFMGLLEDALSPDAAGTLSGNRGI